MAREGRRHHRALPGRQAARAVSPNLDFLCIHPFRDGNGRVSRLLWLLQSYRLGYEVGRYVSLERLVEQNKDRYNETLEESSRGWHEGSHDPWPFVNYVLFIMKAAYREFAERVGETKAPRGSKRELVLEAIERRTGDFTMVELERDSPGVSREMIRRVLREERAKGRVACAGRGPAARWSKKRYLVSTVLMWVSPRLPRSGPLSFLLRIPRIPGASFVTSHHLLITKIYIT